jgi:cardiolipin synthase A/B
MKLSLRQSSSLWQLTTVALWLLALAACASLPDVERELQSLPAPEVTFESGDGPVSEARSEAILSTLEGGGSDTDVLQKHLAYEQAINDGSPLVLGNKLVLLQNGPATYRAMFEAIRAATDHINLETYIIDDDEIGKQFADLLLQKQRDGVQVNLIYDSVGCLNTPTTFFDRLRDGGVQVVEFNPINPVMRGGKLWKLNNRDHRKLLVVDGRVAFVGGINISNDYSSTPLSRRVKKKQGHISANRTSGWRDIHSQIEGPVVAEFQQLFVNTWVKQNGPPLKQDNFFPKLAVAGNEIVRAIGNTANDPKSPIYLTLLSAFSHAERNIYLTIAYFVPDPQLLKALTDAARRGVVVKLILPSYSDSWVTLHLGRRHYDELLHAGVQIYERRGAVMHAKTASIDGVWSTVGSTNLDWRSFVHNDEINAVILGRDFASQMDDMFAEELTESKAITLDSWRDRRWIDRLREWLAGFGAYWM